MSKQIKRYVATIKENGNKYHNTNKNEIDAYIWHTEEECMNQDNSWLPHFEVEEETLYTTPCDIEDYNGEHYCPYADTYTGYESEMCRVCCGLGVDE